jgi:cation diffusion facilitator family transporter
MTEKFEYNTFSRISKLFDRSSAVFPSRISLLVCLFLATAGITIGILTNSLAVTVNGLIAGTEILSSLLFLSAIKQSVRAPDYAFNYGYGKYESMAILAGAALLSLLLINTIIEAVKDFGTPNPVKGHYFLILYSFFSYLIIIKIAAFLKRSSDKYHMPLLAYDADIWKLDGYIELGVLFNLVLGTILSHFELENIGKIIDSFAAIVLLMFSLRMQLKHGKGALDQLLDRTVPENIQYDIIASIAENINRICEFKSVYTRQSGKDIFIEIDIVMPWDYTLEEAYKLEKDIHTLLVAKYPTALPRLYVTPCAHDCVHEGKSFCPIKLANEKFNKLNSEEQSTKDSNNLNII